MSVPANNCSSSFNSDSTACINCRKRNHSLLNDLSQEELTLLNNNKHEVHYKTGEIICKEGTISPGLICLKQGKVKITRTAVNGNKQIVALKKPVDFIGFSALMRESQFENSAIAMEDCCVCIIDKNAFFEVVSNNKTLSFKIIRYFAERLNDANLRQLNLTQKHMRGRIADALLQVHETYGINEEDNYLNVSLKRAEIADLANMTTANAIRVLSSFATENLIETNRRKIKIINMNALIRISRLDQ